MNRLVRRALLVTAALLLVWVSTASAECAWVLWATPNDGSWYIPVEGYETKESCDQRAEQLNREGYKQEQEQGKAKTAVSLCLPDTIDPRGPKGSGR
jgi:hypothetical protein